MNTRDTRTVEFLAALTADAMLQKVKDAEKEYWSSFQYANDAEKEYWSEWAVRRRQIQEELAEMDQRAFLLDARNEGRAEGLAEGEAKGRAEGAMSAYFSLVNDGILSSADAARRVGMTEEEFEARRRAALN